ncbi:MAG TPA: hypothetical protein VI754_14140 [Bacteriovoracaceae bacterium]|nr:hypothetical protein [Bacteriovoracaceae bacterium]
MGRIFFTLLMLSLATFVAVYSSAAVASPTRDHTTSHPINEGGGTSPGGDKPPGGGGGR